jgi:NifB/MoaA-like Fe-S oxidoreductase
VSGLLTGGDIIAQLSVFPDLGSEILIGSNTLNADGLFLDDTTPADIESALGVKVRIVEVG